MEKINCLICGEELKYLNDSKEMECSICGKKIESKTVCKKGHFVCDDCHNTGVYLIKEICLYSKSKNPINLFNEISQKDFIHMHGPEHHILVGSCLLTAYKNAGGNVDLKKGLEEIEKRGKQIPGGSCGYWGACGAGISSGVFYSVITGSNPLKKKEFGDCNTLTSKILNNIGKIGGPRCCKRHSYLSMLNAIDFVEKQMGVYMEKDKIKCEYSKLNKECIKEKCPFYNKFN